MTIYEVLNESFDDSNVSTPADIYSEVDFALQDQFGEDASQWDDVKAKFGDYKTFVNKVIDVLITLDCDSSWIGEVYLQIEGIGQDILDGVDIGTRQKELENLMGINEDGTLNRTSFCDFNDTEIVIPDNMTNEVINALF